jgi:GT2 family glycosyltransferase
MKLLIVILNYRVTDLTLACLGSLAPRIDEVPGTKVIVCENGTGGDAGERLCRAIDENGWSRWCSLVEVFPNRGFTGGNNLVIEDAQPEAGIAGSLLLSPEGQVQASPFRFLGIATELDRGLRLGVASALLSRWGVVPPTPRVPCPVEWVSGASMLLRSAMLEEIGPLDEGLYTYFDDVDICLRARRAGWQTWFAPDSRVIHLEGASTGIGQRATVRRPSYWFEARRRFFLKNHGPWYAAAADAAFIAGFALWRVRRRLQRKPDLDPPFMLADAARHSVFRTGFQVRTVKNPALAE